MSTSLLKSLFGSKTRLKLLKLFLWNHDSEFYLRQLQSLLSEDLTAIRREISKMYEEKLLRKVSRGNRLYYQINASHCFYAPLKELFIQSEGVLGEVVKSLAVVSGSDALHTVVLYGNEQLLLEQNEWKMLCVGSVSRDRIQGILETLERRLNVSIELLLMSRVDYDEKMLSDESELDEVFAGHMIEVKRNGIFL